MTILYILAAILIFGILIAVHEWGHFIAARLCGVTVHEFAIGMGPALYQREKKGTKYAIRLLPIGGYCALEGEEDDSDDPHSLNNQGFWKKVLIFAAGALMNFLVGFLIILCIYTTAQAFRTTEITGFFDGCPYQGGYNLTGEKSKDLNLAIDENSAANTKMEFAFIPLMFLQNITAKIIGVVIAIAAITCYLGGTMELLNTIVMMISAFILFSALETAGSYSALLRSVDLAVTKAQAVLDIEPMDIDGKEIVPVSYDIDVEDIEFSYDKKKIINGISVHIPEHTTTAIVGPSGGGKTTLCHLISRFWDVDSGCIKLGGVDVREYSMDSLMKNFSFVFQNVYLFQDTIANNIRFGQPEASMDLVIEAAKKACCHDFIMALPDGYETMIGEGGASLSGGEKQRISIARAIMKNAPIIILDEATANVDPESEKELTTAIQELTKEKTILMIAHRLKTVRHADKILVIDGGRIVQSGTHETLMQSDGIYRRFVESREHAIGWKI